jgi:hypothetical protein
VGQQTYFSFLKRKNIGGAGGGAAIGSPRSPARPAIGRGSPTVLSRCPGDLTIVFISI